MIRLKLAGYSDRKIAKTLKISRTTLVKYLNQFKEINKDLDSLQRLTEEELYSLVSTASITDNQHDYSGLLKLFPQYELELKKTGVTREHLWLSYQEENPKGYSYSQFCYHFQQWKKNSNVTMHFDHKAGDKLFVDYTGKKLQIVDKATGAIKEVEVFIAILGASQLTYVEASLSQQKADFLKSLANSLKYYGGVPEAIVPDNLKSAVTTPCKYEPEVNSFLDDFAHHYKTTIFPARSRKPRDKALVENAVRNVYNRIYSKLNNQIFFTIEDLNKEIRKLLEEYNQIKFSHREFSREELFKKIEKETLKPLPTSSFELKEYKFYKVQTNGHVKVTADNHFYSVPYRYIGSQVKVACSQSNIEIYHNYTRIACHKRIQEFGYSTISEHMASKHRFMAEWNPERFRNWAIKVGQNTLTLIEYILNSKQYPEQSYKSCLGILNFARKIGRERLDTACKRAIYYNSFSYKTVKSIIEKGLDKNFDPEPNIQKNNQSQNHQNIRGSKYYDQTTLF